MTLTSALVAFVLAAGLLTITPGLDTVLVLRTWMAEGRRSAFLAVLGVQAGCFTWGCAVAVGLGTLLTTAPLAYGILRWFSAIYLLSCGLRMILRPRPALALSDPERGNLRRGRGAFLRGLLTNALNPKVGLFYLSFLPQFVPAGMPPAPFMVGLTMIHIALALVWFGGLLNSASVVRSILTERTGLMQALDRMTGLVFVGFGLRLALERR